MTIKSIVGLYEKMSKGSIMELLMDNEADAKISSLVSELRRDAETAKKAILGWNVA